MNLPEEINKNPSDILIASGLKIIPPHLKDSCHRRFDCCMHLLGLTFTGTKGYFPLAGRGWEPSGMPGFPPACGVQVASPALHVCVE